MPIRGHNIVPLSDHLGYFNRDNQDGIPASRNRVNKNSSFVHFGERTRFGFNEATTINPGVIVRSWPYQRSDEAFTRYIFLASGGFFFDSTNAISIGQIVGCTDFSAITLFNRSYITPHNGQTGQSGAVVYVYDGITFRPAAGLAPVNGAPPFAVTALTAGRITKGNHLVSVAYETDSGFITKPGPYVIRASTGKSRFNVTNIPIGPAGTVYRHILMTKFIKTYDGNPTHYELFFVPGGTILDNVTTSLIINALDSELINSADYLLDLFPTIPAFLGLTTYQGSLVGFGEFGKESVARVSVVGSPESFDTTSGFIIVAPGDGGGLKNSREYRGNLEFWKKNRTFATRSNGDVANTWATAQIDGGYGTNNPRGVTAVLDSAGDSKDTLTVCDDSGLLLFYGRYSDKALTWQVDTEWRARFGGNSSVAVDSINKRLYVVGTQALLMGDFSNGLDPDNIRWSLWTFQDENDVNIVPLGVHATAYQTVVQLTGKKCLFKYTTNLRHDECGSEISSDPPIYTDSAIDNDLILPYIDDENTFLIHFAGVRYRLTGFGNLILSYFKTDNVESALTTRIMSLTPGKDYFNLFNLIDERVAVRFRVNTIDQYIDGIDLVGLAIKGSYKSRLVS